MQQYAVLMGMSGAGLTNGLYLPPGAVVIQLVPYPFRVQLDVGGLAELLGAGDRGYMEWRNKHSDLTDYETGDTVVTVAELVDVARAALDQFVERRRSKNGRRRALERHADAVREFQRAHDEL